MSASEILDEMLSAMPESYQKTIGFPTYDLLAAVSLRMEGTDETINEAKQQLDPENLHDSALDRYIYPRSGLERKAATFAHGSLTVTGTGTVEQGTLFESGGGVQYYATETVAIEGEGTVPVTCTVDGTAGNLPAHSVTQMPVAVQGIASCDNPEPIGGGYAEESDSEYYARYLLRLRTPATSAHRCTVLCHCCNRQGHHGQLHGVQIGHRNRGYPDVRHQGERCGLSGEHGLHPGLCQLCTDRCGHHGHAGRD